MRPAILTTAAFVLLLWLLHFIDAHILPADIKPGVHPRTVTGLIGIALAPLVHGSFGHLISNTMSLLLLGAGALYMYPRACRRALPVLYFAPGAGVWLFARDAYHIGASGLTYGLMFFLLFIGLRRKDPASAGFSAAVLFLYSGMLAGLLPEDSDISFEYHLFGALAGAACAIALHTRDPQLAAAKYDWEDDGDGDDPVIGDQWRMADAAAPSPAADDLYTMDAEDALLDAEWYEADDGDGEWGDGDGDGEWDDGDGDGDAGEVAQRRRWTRPRRATRQPDRPLTRRFNRRLHRPMHRPLRRPTRHSGR